MKFRCGPRAALYQFFIPLVEVEKDWHRWFAWRPVRTLGHDCRWLEFVERRYVQGAAFFHDPEDGAGYWVRTAEYRALKS